MSTGYFTANWRQGGSVPGAFLNVAGAVFPALDYLFTNGPNPWSKVIEGTNIQSYTAPGGSQVKVEIADEYPMSGGGTNSYWARSRCYVGAQVFPTASQETTSSYGHVRLCKAYSTNYLGWWGIRTDRLAIFVSRSIATNCPDVAMIWGDLPVLDPSNDPGMCVNIGMVLVNGYPSLQNIANTTNFENAGALMYGYAYVNKANNVVSCPIYIGSTLDFQPNAGQGDLSNFAGGFPLFPLIVMVSPNQNVTSYPTPRAWIPWFYHVPFNTGATFLKNAVTAGDTFSIGAANFELAYFGSTVTPTAIMLNDQDPLP